MKKMSILFLLGLIVFCSLSFQQKKVKEDVLYWSGSRLLAWSDFQVKTKGIGDEVAITSAGVNSEYSTEKSIMRIICYFSKRKSWVLKGSETIAILKHEQGHFDITEVFARMFRKRAMATSFSKNNIKDKYTKISNEITLGLDKEQALYDKETNHGIDSVKQVEWNKTISTDLEKYKDYANDTLIHLKL